MEIAFEPPTRGGGGSERVPARDRLFGEVASRARTVHPHFAIVVVNLPQQCSDLYCKQFSEVWLIEWPSRSMEPPKPNHE